ncbi:uncharacterized protein [Eucyclogobius newberryi]|uniref:uncharacterized protein n=1 Tax=Eucyclogobius newberryi TaxID=166745 RepID=UPI003B5C3E0E
MEYHSGGSLPLLGRPRYCPGANANGGYLCETGHCCGESGCCTYYYELWWFWLLWTVLILFSCCCAYRHRRAKLRVQQQQRQRDISLLAYQGASSFPSSMLDLSFLASLKLPSYEEVAAQPSTPPPPYSSVFTAPRYPQPPRTADPHLLTHHPGAQHPGALLHRPLQPLSDGPSSLSSDNSSSCSCDSCCPSSPCSSSLSAPVTYETDTSHTSTPSEATPLTLDSVTMETISAAASNLERDKRDDSVAVSIEGTHLATESVVAVATGSASPSEAIATPGSDATFPVGITPPIKQQLDVRLTAANPTSCPQSTEKSSSPTTSPPASLNLPRTFDSTTSHKQPRTLNLILDSIGGNTDRNPSLVPISNVQKSTPETTLSNTSPTRTLHLLDAFSAPDKSPICIDPVATISHRSSVPSPPSQGISHFSTAPAGEPSQSDTKASNITRQNEEATCFVNAPSETPEASRPAPTSEADVFGSETVATNVDQKSENADTSTLQNSGLLQAPKTSLELTTSPPETSDKHNRDVESEVTSRAAAARPVSETLRVTQKPSTTDVDSRIQSPTVSQNRGIATTLQEPASECVSIAMPDHPNLDRPVLSLAVATKEPSCHKNTASSLHFYKDGPGLNTDFASWTTFDRKTVDLSSTNSADEKTLSKSLPTESALSLGVPQSQSLNLERPFAISPTESGNSRSPDARSFFPAITIRADPPSFAASPSSPCSIPSPSPLSPPPVSMLLLDPLAALHPSERSAASSGHASSLSPSPRNTQSPPKQTLFSPCVDIFEPVDPDWDDEESEGPADEEYCEDSDVAADESQYRHRRLTGDSGIEVCRCRVEDEDDEDDDVDDEKEELKQDGGKDGAEIKSLAGGPELHDSVDCPVRSQKGGGGGTAAAEDINLRNTEATHGSDESAAIPVETA